VINSGHRRGGWVIRTVGDDHEPRRFSTYAACAIALIGKLPATLHDRSAPVIDLKRRLRSEPIESFRCDRTAHLDVLARKAARWTADKADQIRDTDPELPAALFNRDADNWRPLLAIAQVAGGKWPELAREVAKLCCAISGVDDAAQLELLLGDVRDIFNEQDHTEMASGELVKALVALEGRPWAEMGKSRKPLTQNRLARMLKPLGIAPGNVGPEDNRKRGYSVAQFRDAIDRYLAPEGASQPPIRTDHDETGTSQAFQTAQPDPGCADVKCTKPNNDGLLGSCALSKGGNSQDERALPSDERQHRPPTVNGHEVIGAAAPGSPCALCGKNGTVYLIRDPLRGVRSEPLHETCAAAWFRRDEPGLSRVRIRELADWYSDETHRRYRDDTLDTAALDGELRTTLREQVAFPEHVEIEFERVMRVVFAPK